MELPRPSLYGMEKSVNNALAPKPPMDGHLIDVDFVQFLRISARHETAHCCLLG